MAHTAYTCSATEQACTTHMGSHGFAKANYLAFGAHREDWPPIECTQPTDWALIKKCCTNEEKKTKDLRWSAAQMLSGLNRNGHP